MTESTSHISHAEPGDCKEVVTLWKKCELIRPWNDADSDFRLAVDAEGSDILILRIKNGIVGAAMVGFDGHRGWVYYLAVDPTCRQMGLGRKLMHAAEKWLAQRGAPKIQFMVRDDNTQALGFYETLGYEKQAVVTLGRRLD